MKATLRRSFALVLFASLARGADLTSSGDWVESINASHLVSGAGSDLQTQFESISGVTTLTITNAPGAWTVRARLGGSGGHSDVAVSVKRTSSGSGSGTIEDGTSYMPLAGSDAVLFTGTEDRSGVSVQFKLTGLSRNVSPATYLSSIIFTIQ